MITTLTRSTTKTIDNDKYTAIFDVCYGLPPANTSLDSEYFQTYIKEVVRTGKTPF